MSGLNLTYLGYGYGCEDATGDSYLSHLCYAARKHHPLRLHGSEPGCGGSVPSAPCPQISELLKRPSCHGCDEYARPNGVHGGDARRPTDPRAYFAHQTSLMTGGSPSYGAAAARPCVHCTAGTGFAARNGTNAAAAAVAAVAAAAQRENDARSQPVVVEGRLIDMRAHSINVGNCANGKSCAKAGTPVGVLVAHGGGGGGGNGSVSPSGNRAYVLLASAPQLARHMNTHVRVSGRLMHDSGAVVPERIEVLNASTQQYEQVPSNRA